MVNMSTHGDAGTLAAAHLAVRVVASNALDLPALLPLAGAASGAAAIADRLIDLDRRLAAADAALGPVEAEFRRVADAGGCAHSLALDLARELLQRVGLALLPALPKAGDSDWSGAEVTQVSRGRFALLESARVAELRAAIRHAGPALADALAAAAPDARLALDRLENEHARAAASLADAEPAGGAARGRRPRKPRAARAGRKPNVELERRRSAAVRGWESRECKTQTFADVAKVLGESEEFVRLAVELNRKRAKRAALRKRVKG